MRTKILTIFWVVVAIAAATVVVLVALSLRASSTSPIALVIRGGTLSSTTIPLIEVSSTQPTVGAETYAISQAPGTWPEIVQATIDPQAILVGQTQHLNIVTEDTAAITSVEALIQTDHGTTTLPLTLIGPVAADQLMPVAYAVDAKGHVVPANGTGYSLLNVAHAGLSELAYGGQWTVRDTHNAFYKTTFIAEDALGRRNSITLAWSDACSLPVTGSYTMTTSCADGIVDGIDGSLTIASGTTFTLQNTFYIPTGYSYSVTINHGGALAIQGAGSLHFQTVDCSGGVVPGNSVPWYGAETSACGTYGYSTQFSYCQANGAWSSVTNTLSSPPADTQATYYSALTSACGTYGSGSQAFNCQSNGTFNNSPPYTYTSPPAATTRTMYLNNVADSGNNETDGTDVCPVIDQACQSQVQTCQSNGSFNGTYAQSSCTLYPGGLYSVTDINGNYDYCDDGTVNVEWNSYQSTCTAEANSVCTGLGMTGTSGACQELSESYFSDPGSDAAAAVQPGWQGTPPTCGNQAIYYFVPDSAGTTGGIQSYAGNEFECNSASYPDECDGYSVCNDNAEELQYCD